MKKKQKTTSCDLRDYFAGRALTGICGNEPYLAYVRGFYRARPSDQSVTTRGHASLAAEAYRVADAMLKARDE
jgi:hypothetical protein